MSNSFVKENSFKKSKSFNEQLVKYIKPYQIKFSNLIEQKRKRKINAIMNKNLLKGLEKEAANQNHSVITMDIELSEKHDDVSKLNPVIHMKVDYWIIR